MDPIQVTMDQVETIRHARHRIEHGGASGSRINRWPTEAQRTRADGHEGCARRRVAAREQRHFTTKVDQFFGKPGDHPFRSTVELRWHTLRQRGYLSDAHTCAPRPHSKAAGGLSPCTRALLPILINSALSGQASSATDPGEQR